MIKKFLSDFTNNREKTNKEIVLQGGSFMPQNSPQYY